MAHSYADSRADAAALHAAPRPDAGHGLLWTDLWYLAAIAIAVLLTLDPWRMEGADRGSVRHLALALGAPAVLLALTLRAALPERAPGPSPIGAPLGVAWPIALFALMALAGSTYARVVDGVDSTFLVYGLYAVMLFLSAAMVVQCRSPLAFVRAYFALLVPAALLMSAALVVFAGQRQVYHEEIFLVVPMAALVFASQRSFLLRWCGAAFFVSMGWFSHKLTSYAVAALAAGYLAFFIWLPRLRLRDALGTLAAAYWGALGLAGALAGAALYAMRNGGAGQPSGNLEFRMHTYYAAWERFLDSPLWGDWFAREAVNKFTLFDVGIAHNMLPTHSDLLDLLASGGLLAFGLFLGGIAAIGLHAWRRLLHPAAIDRPEAAYAHALALMSLAAIVVCAINPILLQPQMAALVWSNLGVLLGLSLRAEGLPPGGASSRP
jgi:O-antigen ligase